LLENAALPRTVLVIYLARKKSSAAVRHAAARVQSVPVGGCIFQRAGVSYQARSLLRVA
jgi:hypothetical protein